IGIIAASNTTVVSAESVEQLHIGDQIIAVDGVSIKRDTHGPEPDLLGWHATELIAADPTKTLTLTVMRAGKQLQVSLPPVALKQPHVSFGMGPVVGVIPGSVGDEAGFLKGDVIQSVNGQPAGDPVTLPQRMANLTGERVVFQVMRSSGPQSQNTQEIIVESLPVSHFLTPAAPYSTGCLQGLGVAYGCDNIVASSDIAGVQPGDRLDSVQLVKTPENKEKVETRKLHEQPLDDYLSWFYIHQTGQADLLGFNLQLNFSRDQSDKKIAVIPAWEDSTENFSWERGIRFAPLERVHQASGWGAAFQLGIHRTGQDMSRVGQTIGWIAGGQASISDLGGPVMIIKVAKDEAAVDVTRLLLFLTMLSANLAIINFLPIPILDGGHFVFLTIELIRRKPVSERIQGSLSIIFLFALLGFMVFIVSNDVFRLWFQ
ncbi:MAG: site-2 protease family protein, partial [Pirellulaceae bacterium]|nr:site-2 protease family protein [Pirellulaceae bacterium]